MCAPIAVGCKGVYPGKTPLTTADASQIGQNCSLVYIRLFINVTKFFVGGVRLDKIAISMNLGFDGCLLSALVCLRDLPSPHWSKPMQTIFTLLTRSLAVLSLSAPAMATQVYWTDWIAAPNLTSATGEIHVQGETVQIGYSATGSHGFVQTGTGINYWTGTPYTQGTVDNAPPAAELIALNSAGEVSIVFSRPVVDPYIAITSWNGNTVEFGQPISFDSYGAGYWGNGTPQMNSAGTGFYGNGEVHGVIRLKGTYQSLSFTHTSEYWHGFTVGVSAVPWPSSFWLFATGLLAVVPRVRRLRYN